VRDVVVLGIESVKIEGGFKSALAATKEWKVSWSEEERNEPRRLSSVTDVLEVVHHLVKRCSGDVLQNDDKRESSVRDPAEHLADREDGGRRERVGQREVASRR